MNYFRLMEPIGHDRFTLQILSQPGLFSYAMYTMHLIIQLVIPYNFYDVLNLSWIIDDGDGLNLGSIKTLSEESHQLNRFVVN